MNHDVIKKKLIIGLVTIIIVFALYKVSNGSESVLEISGEVSDEIKLKSTTSIQEHKDIKVYICGEITNEGVYEISEDERLDQLIEKAGGFTEKANKDNLNLAMKLKDGERIKIYSIDDIEVELKSKYTGIEKINHMNIEELKTIPGIGDKIGEDIINYISQNGYLSDYNQLLDIDGIGESKLKKIIEFVD